MDLLDAIKKYEGQELTNLMSIHREQDEISGSIRRTIGAIQRLVDKGVVQETECVNDYGLPCFVYRVK